MYSCKYTYVPQEGFPHVAVTSVNSIKEIRTYACVSHGSLFVVCEACLQWVRQTSSHSYVCTFVYCVTADEKVEDSDDVLKALEAVVDRKQCVHCANLCMPV